MSFSHIGSVKAYVSCAAVSLRVLCVGTGSSDESKSDSEEEEQKLWEDTQIFKGLKRRPGEQVGRPFH